MGRQRRRALGHRIAGGMGLSASREPNGFPSEWRSTGATHVMRRRVILLGIAVALVSVNGCGSGTSPRTTTGGSSERAGHTLNSSPSGATSESNLPAPIAGPSTFFSVPTTSLSEMSVYSWDGVVIDRSTAAVPLECCAVDQSPDGSRIWAATSTGTVLLDRLGSLLQANFAGGTWSDDDVHLCEVQRMPLPAGRAPSTSSVPAPRAAGWWRSRDLVLMKRQAWSSAIRRTTSPSWRRASWEGSRR